MLIEDLQHVHYIGRFLLKVRIDDGRKVSRRSLQASQQRCLLAEIAREADYPHPVLRPVAERPELCDGGVPAAVIHKDQLCVRHQFLPQRFYGFIIKQIDISLFVEAGYNYG